MRRWSVEGTKPGRKKAFTPEQEAKIWARLANDHEIPRPDSPVPVAGLGNGVVGRQRQNRGTRA